MKHLLLLFLLPFLLFSCKKEPDSGPSSAEGVVIDATTQQPVPFANVALARRPSDIISSVGFSQVQSVQANDQGRFSLSFDAVEEYNYYLFGLAPRYLYPVEPVSLKRGRKNKVNVPIWPEAYVRVHVKNVNPFNQWDEFVFTDDSYPQPRFIGDAVDTTIIVITRGQYDNQLTWLITKNFIQQNFSYTIYTTAHDTTDFQIHY